MANKMSKLNGVGKMGAADNLGQALAAFLSEHANYSAPNAPRSKRTSSSVFPTAKQGYGQGGTMSKYSPSKKTIYKSKSAGGK